LKFIKKPKKPSIIEAEQYRPGMEDGFEIRYQDVHKPYHTKECQTSEKEVPVNVPYIKIKENKKYLRVDDWILKCWNGRQSFVHNEEFIRNYEKVE
jgi:hypothetical protein